MNLDTPALAENLLAKAGIVLPLRLPSSQTWPVPHDYRRVIAEVAAASLIFDRLTALQTRVLRVLRPGEAIKDAWFTIHPTGRVELVPNWLEATLSGGPSPWSDMPPRRSEPGELLAVALEVLSIDLMSPAKQRAQWNARMTARAALITALTAVGTLTLGVLDRVCPHEHNPVTIDVVLPSPPLITLSTVEATFTPEAKIFRDRIAESLLNRDDPVAIAHV